MYDSIHIKFKTGKQHEERQGVNYQKSHLKAGGTCDGEGEPEGFEVLTMVSFAPGDNYKGVDIIIIE